MMQSDNNSNMGFISAINGSLIEIKGLEKRIRLHDLVKVKRYKIIGETIQIHLDYIVVQCFENTSNLRINDDVINLNVPLSMELGPGLLSNVFDGTLRPLQVAFEESDGFGLMERGLEIPSLSRTKKWHFKPLLKVKEEVTGGTIVGTVKETELIENKIMVPPEHAGVLSFIAGEGDYTITETIYKIKQDDKEIDLCMLQTWPVTQSRPYQQKLRPNEPLITGMRVIDLLFPVAKGGTVAVPGGFGTGKTIIQHSLAKWCNADVIIFVGCGERGNEIADVLKQFAEIIDPQSGRPLLERIVLIANTSNMPVSAREASIFSGVTIAEYYRDMGYNVALLADSTSRWAESLREISGLLEEMPAEEGYPAYLPSKLSSFYERAGVVKTLGNNLEEERIGTLTIIGSVSPPAGDFNEPVTSTTKRFVQAFWALDAGLAYSKHYPAINWRESYSNYPEYILNWWIERDIRWTEIDIDWFECRKQVNEILSIENDLKNITQLIGEENLPEDQQLLLFIAKLIKDSFLIQNAFDEIDCYTDSKKILGQIKLILLFFKKSNDLLKERVLFDEIKDLDVILDILRISHGIPNEEFSRLESLKNKVIRDLESLKYIVGI